MVDILQTFSLKSSPDSLFHLIFNEDGTTGILKYSVDKITEKDNEQLKARFGINTENKQTKLEGE